MEILSVSFATITTHKVKLLVHKRVFRVRNKDYKQYFQSAFPKELIPQLASNAAMLEHIEYV